MKRLTFFALISLLSGCNPGVNDLKLYIAQVKQNTAINIEPNPQFSPKPSFVYSANELRSPFQDPRNMETEIKQIATLNCTQPDFSRNKHPLEKFGIEALTLTGFLNSKGKKWALIQSNTGRLFKVSIGDHLGLFFGRIDSISDGVVSFTEMLPDGAGCWQKKHSTLTIPSKAGEKNV